MRPRRLLAALLALAVLTALGVWAGGCGSNSTKQAAATATTPVSSAARKFYEEPKPDADRDADGEEPDADDGKRPEATDRDGDQDSSGKSLYDSDDGRVAELGHPASAADSAAVATLVHNYYAVANSGDGAKACSMLYSVFEEAVPSDFGTSPPGPGYARGSTCPQVLTKVFAHFREKIQANFPKLNVARVRVDGREAVAVLTFGSRPERVIHAMREGHKWTIDAMIDEELP